MLMRLGAVAMTLGVSLASLGPADFRPHGIVNVHEELNKYEVFTPRVASQPLSSHSTLLPQSGDVNPALRRHADNVQYELDAFGEKFHLDLKLSKGLFAQEFVEVVHGENGLQANPHPVENCYYHGTVAGEEGSSVSGSTCKGLDALIRMRGDKYVVMPLSQDMLLAKRYKHLYAAHAHEHSAEPHVIFRVSDMKKQPAFGCGHEAGESHGADMVNSFSALSGTTPVKTEALTNSRKLLQTCDANTRYKTWVAPGTGTCACKTTWQLSGTTQTFCNGECAAPDGDSKAWCFTVGRCNGNTWAYCSAPSSTQPQPQPTPRPTQSAPVSTPTPRPTAPLPTPRPTASTTPATTSPIPNAGTNYVELLIVNDYAALRKAEQAAPGKGLSNVIQNAKNVANEVQALYRTLNMGINIVLKGVYTFQKDEPSDLYTAPSGTINNYLDRFSTWRTRINKWVDADLKPCTAGSPGCLNLKNDNAALITGDDRSGSTTGLAWVGTMCSGTSSASVNEYNGNWQFLVETVAHEMGHNWGAKHDSDSNTCDQSKHLMAAVGCGNCPFTGFKTWSSCSTGYIRTGLQNLLNTPNNCLANDPGIPWGTDPICGDGYKTTGEDCDLGTQNGPNSLCSSTCKFNAGVQCASGDCCDTSTGRFKAKGASCRQAMHQCDLPDTCSGVSATCDQDLFKSDGTDCSEGGKYAKCYKGSCLGYDNQCSAAFTGYTGTWIGWGPKDGTCMQAGKECGELICTQASYCKPYDCPSGYKCTVGSQILQGPMTIETCSCASAPKQENTVAVMVKDGTPCQVKSGDHICLAGACVARPTSAATKTCNDQSCSGHGTCGQTLDNDIGCVCNPGWTGADCSTAVPCDKAACDALNREACIADNVCGPCKINHATTSLTGNVPTDSCSLQQFEVTETITIGNYKAGVEDSAKSATDGNVYSHWSQDFSVDKSERPELVTTWNGVGVLDRYDVVSTNVLPQMDPKAWTLYGSQDCLTWTQIDEQTDIEFQFRHQTKSFLVKTANNFSALKFVVKEVFDPAAQSVSALTPADEGTTVVKADGTKTTTEATTTKKGAGDNVVTVQVAELQFYSRRHDGNASPVTKDTCLGNVVKPPVYIVPNAEPESALSAAAPNATGGLISIVSLVVALIARFVMF